MGVLFLNSFCTCFYIFVCKKLIKKVLLDIKDDKAIHLMEVLKSLPFVKAKTISDEKALLIEEIKEAVDNLNLVRQGKMKARSAKDLLNDL